MNVIPTCENTSACVYEHVCVCVCVCVYIYIYFFFFFFLTDLNNYKGISLLNIIEKNSVL